MAYCKLCVQIVLLFVLGSNVYYVWCVWSFSGEKLTHANSTLYAKISPQWLSALRRLWPNFR